MTGINPFGFYENMNFGFMSNPLETGFLQMPAMSNYSIVPPLDFRFSQNYIDDFISAFTKLCDTSLFTPALNADFDLATDIFTPSANNAIAKNYGNYTYDISQKFEGSAEDIDKHLEGKLAGKGKKLMELQEKYGVSASVLAAIAMNESARGTSDGAVYLNNVGGVMTASSNYTKLAKFDSVDDCLESMASNLRRNYINEGLKTISQVHEKYCPIGAKNDPKGMNGGWGRVVSSINNDIIKTAKA